VEQELATFSNDFTALASDLASFNNTTPEEAINAIGSALRGESEPLRKYNVLLNDAKLKAAALELGIYSGSGALTDQQKDPRRAKSNLRRDRRRTRRLRSKPPTASPTASANYPHKCRTSKPQ
jgi:hypothetical protein